MTIIVQGGRRLSLIAQGGRGVTQAPSKKGPHGKPGGGGSGSSFVPTKIGNLSFWLDASQLALSNNDPVGTWADVSGNGRDFTQATSGNRPTFKTGIQNGQSAVQFDGTNDNLIRAIDLSAVNKVTLVFVMNWISFASDDALFCEFTANYNFAPTGGWIINPGNSSAPGADKFNIGTKVSTAYSQSSFTRPTDNTWHSYLITVDRSAAPSVITALLDNAAPSGYVDDTALAGSGLLANDTLYLGSRNQASLFGDFYLGEFLLYTGLLTTGEKNQLYTYHKAKWAVP